MNLPAERPRCPTHGCYMDLVPTEHQTREQKWCGVWYECPRTCYNSVLYKSSELVAFLEEQAAAHAARKQQQELFA